MMIAIAMAIVNHLIENYPGIEVEQSFYNAEEALEALRNSFTKPDLIMLDLNMPVKDGWDVLDEMKNLPAVKHVIVAVFTSSIDERDRKKSGNYNNVLGHFVKPMTREMLQEIVARISNH